MPERLSVNSSSPNLRKNHFYYAAHTSRPHRALDNRWLNQRFGESLSKFNSNL